MKHLLLILATYLALATQAACGATLAIGGCRPPLMWLPVVLALTWFGDTRGIAWTALIGLLADGLAGGRFGVEMLAATLTAALTLSLRPDEDARSRGVWLVWQFAVIATGLVLSSGLNSVLSDGPAVTMGSFAALAGEAAYGLVVCGGFGLLGSLRPKNAARYHHA
jgi:cell shape-determining protein MreD